MLIGVIERIEPTVLLHPARRASQRSSGAGRLSRRQDRAGQRRRLQAALREAYEETGLEDRFIDPIGYLDIYVTSRNYRIVPTLARVTPGFELTLNTEEVDDTRSRCRCPF